jgi:hypothetical protein
MSVTNPQRYSRLLAQRSSVSVLPALLMKGPFPGGRLGLEAGPEARLRVIV